MRPVPDALAPSRRSLGLGQWHREDLGIICTEQFQLDERPVWMGIGRSACDIGNIEVVVVSEHNRVSHDTHSFNFLEQRIDGGQRVQHHGLADRHDAERVKTGCV